MELSLRLDTLGMVEVRYLCGVAFFALPPLLLPLPSCFSFCHLTWNAVLTVILTDDGVCSAIHNIATAKSV